MDFSQFFEYPEGETVETPERHLIFLPRASEEDWERLVAHCTLRPFAAGTEVIHRGDTHQALYIVARGSLEVVYRDGATPRRLAEVGEGSVFGEQTFFDGAPRSADVLALSDGEVLELTLEKFEVLAGHAPLLARTILFDLARILSLRLRQTTEVALAAGR